MMFRGITFNGEKHTYDDWGLVLSKNPIPPQPTVNTSLLEVPGGNGFVNLSAALTGDVTYSTREGEFTFTCTDRPDQWAEIYSEISNYLHGQEMQIVLDDDPDVYYTGVLKVDPFESNERAGEIVIKYTLNPFRFAKRETTVDVDMENAALQSVWINEVGNNVSAYSWNTDLRFGTQNIPTHDFSVYQMLQWSWKRGYPHDPYRWEAQFVDGNGNYYERMMDFYDPVKAQHFFLISDLADAGLDVSTIWRALLSGIGSAKLRGITHPCISVHVDSGKRPVIPVISCPVDGIRVSCDGKIVTLSKGLNRPEDIIIRGDTELLFFGEKTAGTVTVTYRKGWL